jgi:glycerol-3-phosphate dehydrogenase
LQEDTDVFDLAIVGAGIVGLMVAYRLSSSGKKVCVLEKEDGPGRGVTAGQANVIHVVQLPFGSEKSKLARKGNVMYDELCRKLGVKIRRMPALLVVRAWLSSPVLFFAYLYLRYSLRGHFPVRLMRGGALRKLEPSLSQSVKSGIVVDGYGTVDVVSLVSRLKEESAARGVSFRFGCEVRGAETVGDFTVIKTSNGELKARFIVNAAGLYSDEVAKLLGADLGRLEPGLGVMAVYSGPGPRCVVAPLPITVGSRTKGGAIIPATDGTTIVGPTLRIAASKEENSFSQEDLDLLARKFGPLLATKGEMARAYVGVRPLSPTRDFIVRKDATRRCVHLVGIESPGLTAAPAIAEAVEELVQGEAS